MARPLKIPEDERRKCYKKYLRYKELGTQRTGGYTMARLAREHNCSVSAIYQILVAEHGGPLGRQSPQRSSGPPTAQRRPERNRRMPARYRDVKDPPQPQRRKTAKPSSGGNPNPPRVERSTITTRSQDSQQKTVSWFLTSHGIGYLESIFKEHGFSTSADLKVLRGFPDRTLELVLQTIKTDRRVKLKDWGTLHAALTTQL